MDQSFTLLELNENQTSVWATSCKGYRLSSLKEKVINFFSTHMVSPVVTSINLDIKSGSWIIAVKHEVGPESKLSSLFKNNKSMDKFCVPAFTKVPESMSSYLNELRSIVADILEHPQKVKSILKSMMKEHVDNIRVHKSQKTEMLYLVITYCIYSDFFSDPVEPIF